jgi:deoxyribodipyrimidine photo-lyase
MDQDPEGIFIKKWIPELKSLETIFIHEPWKKDHGLDYPAPIVDEKNARKEATQKIYALRKTPEHKTQAKQIIKKHASRKYRIKPKKSFPKQNPKLEQLLLPF